MESARIHHCDNLLNGGVGRVIVTNGGTTKRPNSLVDSRRRCRIGIVYMYFGERHAAALCSFERDERTSVYEALGAPDDRPARTGKKFDVAGPAAPSWRWHVHGSCLTRDLNVPLHARMLLGRPLSDLGDDQAISRVYSLFLGYRVIRRKKGIKPHRRG